MSTKTMFVAAKSTSLARIISIKSVSSARVSIRELNSRFGAAKTKPAKIRLARAATLASNRSAASAKRKNLSDCERAEFRAIADLYSRAGKRLFAAYNKIK